MTTNEVIDVLITSNKNVVEIASTMTIKAILIKISEYDWPTKKDAILKHCVDEMNKKDKKNVVFLFDHDYLQDIGNDLKMVIKDNSSRPLSLM